MPYEDPVSVCDNPQLLLKLITTESHFDHQLSQFPYGISRLRPGSDAPLLDIVASFVANRHNQFVAVFASTREQQAIGTLETTLYLFGDTPSTTQSYLQSIFTLLRGIQPPVQEQKKIMNSISKVVYNQTWERWTYYLQRVINSLEFIEEKATELGLEWQLGDPSRGPFSDIRALGEVLTMSREEGVAFAVPMIARLYHKWKAEKRFETKLSRHSREPLGLFPYIESAVGNKLGLSIPFCQWISKILSVYTHSAALVRLKSFKIIQGTVNIVTIPPLSLVPNSPSPVITLDIVKPAVLHTRITHGGLATMEYYRWHDPIYDDAAHQFSEWSTEKLQTSDRTGVYHPHYEVQALAYIHEHGLRDVYPYIASSDLPCGTCKLLIEMYYDIRGTGALQMASNLQLNDTCPIPQFEGEFGEKFRKMFLGNLEGKVAWTAIKWIGQLPVPNGYWRERKRSFASRTVVESESLPRKLLAAEGESMLMSS
ncbi:hypothetical protein E1B28_003355 [Marasmius oreades]|uniref:Uncharacterized protein n=1 Tax=Marasmius oreades TaxID=181124 RepID=A0A9P7UJQ9_9AGAR|nr:uncharacterized protein E1B28_003355 [Marasmius oreades]KAG7085817.1 hypothetical protein E1B28_003355 [Marasmius oreades]